MTPSYISWGKKVRAPQWVDLGFTSYSEGGERFSRNRQLIIFVDNEVKFSGYLKRAPIQSSGRVSTTEVMDLKIPYSLFLQLVSGGEVKMKVGNIQFALTREHIDALRDMKELINSAVSFT